MQTYKKANSFITVTPQFKLASISVTRPQIKLKKSTRINHKSLFIGDKEKILFKLINSKRPKSREKLQKSFGKNSETRKNADEKVSIANNKLKFFHFALNSKHAHSPNHYYPDFHIANSPNPHKIQKLRTCSNKKKNLIKIDSALIITKKEITHATSAQGQYLSVD